MAKAKLNKPKDYMHNSRYEARMTALKLDLRSEVVSILFKTMPRSEDLKKRSNAIDKAADQIVECVYGNSDGKE